MYQDGSNTPTTSTPASTCALALDESVFASFVNKKVQTPPSCPLHSSLGINSVATPAAKTSDALQYFLRHIAPQSVFHLQLDGAGYAKRGFAAYKRAVIHLLPFSDVFGAPREQALDHLKVRRLDAVRWASIDTGTGGRVIGAGGSMDRKCHFSNG